VDVPPGRLDVLKALGDNTRYAIYLELARSAVPLATAEIAESLDLHPNTVRPHLERMRDVGLLDVEVSAKQAIGRPQHLYSIAADAPSLGLEPPTFPMLASMLVRLADRGGLGAEDAHEVGHEQGVADAARYRRAPSCLEAIVHRLDALGFDPQVGDAETSSDGSSAVIGFAHCPFRELAEAFPHLVCSLHHGMMAGFVEAMGDADLDQFHSLEHREPCQLTLTSR
jgi:predicted ArsR family transcriptional regulator